MGARGPVGKRDAERRRRNKPEIETTTVNLDELIAGEVEIPAPDEEWHPLALLTYESAMRSGQAIFMEPSDWAALYLMCEQIHRGLEPQPVPVGTDSDGGTIYEDREIPMPGATLAAITKVMGSLMMLEGDRRRLKIELERKKQKDAAASGGNVTSITKTRGDRFKKAGQTG